MRMMYEVGSLGNPNECMAICGMKPATMPADHLAMRQNNNLEKHNSRIFTISSLPCKLSPKRTLTQQMCNRKMKYNSTNRLTMLALEARRLMLSLLEEKRAWSCSRVQPHASMAFTESRTGTVYLCLLCTYTQHTSHWVYVALFALYIQTIHFHYHHSFT